MENIEKILKAHKLTIEDLEHIKKILGREPNFVEIGIFSAMWSEHCSYKSSKIYLKGFPTKAPWVIQGPGENAGVIDIGGGYAAVFKMESHNHPSFIEPYQGAATGVGGILRDVFTMGARPVANLNSIRFGDIEDRGEWGRKHRYLLKGVVAGIGDYGNCMGVPTVGGECAFEECYKGNILVNAMTVGVVKSDAIFYGNAEGIGNPVIYVGSKTGRDGLGGAVMSSDSFNEESKNLRPTVQVGDPFTEKLLLEACLEMFKEDLIVGIQDMGAAGLTSSSFEMAGRAGSGMRMYLDRVPAREEGMTPYEFMLSESQERMLICAKKGNEDRIKEIFDKYELDCATIGEVTDTGRMELFWHGELAADIPVAPVSNEAPELNRPIKEPEYLKEIKDIDINRSSPECGMQEAFLKIFSSPEVADKSWVYEQYDSMVQTNTVVGAGELDGSVVRIKENGKALALSVDCNARFCYVNPRIGAAMAVMESGRNVAVRGAKPLAITDCLNFGNPMNPEVMWQFKEATDGIKEACLALNTPVVSGNVSLYNETEGVSVYPTPTIGMVGVIDRLENITNSSFKKEGNILVLLGDTKSSFGGSLYLKRVCKKVGGSLDAVDFNSELNLWHLLSSGIESKIIKSAKDVNVGGIAVALAKMCASSSFGVNANSDFGDVRDIFEESPSRAIVEIEKRDFEEFVSLSSKFDIPVKKIGEIGGDVFSLDSIEMPLEELKSIYFESFANILTVDE